METYQSGSNVLFILLGAIMVLAMHAGFAFLEVGTVRKKNQVNALVKILTDFGISTVAYFFIGYSIAYGVNFFSGAEVLMAMLSSGSICAVARRYGVPESTIRSWMAEEAGRSDAFAKERQAAAREIAIRASLGARAQVSYLQSRVDESQRAAQVQAKLHRKLDEDTRARCFAVGTLLKSDAEELADATETGLVLYAAEDSYDRQLDSEERKLLDAQLERYGERVMSDKNAAAMATVLMTVAEKAAAMVPAQSQSEGDAPPLVEIGAESREEKGPEVMVDGA